MVRGTERGGTLDTCRIPLLQSGAILRDLLRLAQVAEVAFRVCLLCLFLLSFSTFVSSQRRFLE